MNAGIPTEYDDVQSLSAVREGTVDALWRVPHVGWQPGIDPPPTGLVSGSFNPRHAGHDALRDAAEDWIGGPVHFELPLVNADKPPLDVETAGRRCIQFHDHPLLVTRAAAFVEKARILPGMTFVVGADTALRVVAPRFYRPGNDSQTAEDAMRDSLDELLESGCRFLVAARVVEGRLVRLTDMTIPGRFRGLFAELPEARFRLDISSSALRPGAASDGKPSAGA